MIMNHNTGVALNDEYLRLGDVLRGKVAVEATILWDEDKNEYGVSINGRPDTWFKLEDYLSRWDDLKVVRNINKRP